MIRAGLVIILLALIVVFGARLVDVRAPKEKALVSTPNDSDYYMLDAVIRQMDENGQLEYRMTSAETLHFPDESARLTDIHVNYKGESNNLWDLVAARGRIPAGERDILLHDGVELVRKHEGQERIKVNTQRAWVRPDQDQVDTDVAIRATAPGQSVSATGMTLYLKQNRVILNTDVQVIYQP